MRVRVHWKLKVRCDGRLEAADWIGVGISISIPSMDGEGEEEKQTRIRTEDYHQSLPY